jgi:hypothetical protein
MGLLKQSTARARTFLMVASSDHLTGIAAASPVVTLSKAGAAFAAAGGAVTDLGNGWYSIALTTTDTNTLGDLAFHVTGTGADPTDWADEVSARITDDLSTPGTAQTITANQNVNVAQWNGTNVAAPATAGVPKVAIEDATSFAQAAADKVWSTAARTLSAFGFSVTVGTNNDKTGYALSAAAIQAIWDALTSALTTVGSIGKRIADNLDTLVSSRSTYAGADTSGTTTLLGRLTSGRATNLDNLDATVSSRSTYAGADTAGTTTLLTRVPGVVPVAADYTAARATKLDNLDAAVSSRGTSTLTTADTIGADVKKINGTTVNGNGSSTPWGP